jgi:hypothetical protein
MRGGRLLYDEYVVYDPNQGSYPSPPTLSPANERQLCSQDEVPPPHQV